MEILHRGVPPEKKGKVYEATCRRCETVVRFEQGEGRVTCDQRNGNYVTVECPVCGSHIYREL